ncbi:MAG: hypothetical protein FP816_18455 [Desulfobacteraceae bacterium]|nr:hypothetical protein [Desulfobacteraceae bacterium]MBU4055673.1 hypothetical protein [Pseudomonadota bacterium]
MGIGNLESEAENFLEELFKVSKGNPSFSISMYQIGEALSMDRTTASKTAEFLMGNNLVEVKTLSGGIGITAAAVSALKEKAESGEDRHQRVAALTLAPVIDSPSRTAIEGVLTQIKVHVSQAGLPFDSLTGIVADVKTIEAQLISPSPKTAILRECFLSLESWLGKTSLGPLKEAMKSILGNQ